MAASVSHEIKNVLAIINENAGLLQDMLGMHEKGMPLSPERLSRLAQSIARQVSRGDGIVKGMNRFAHSADDAKEKVDVGALVQFMTRLAGRLIGMQGQPPHIQDAGRGAYRYDQPLFSRESGVALFVPGHGRLPRR